MRIDLTHAARAWACSHSTVEGLKKRVRDELADLEGQGCKPQNLMFHCFTWNGGIDDGSQEFILAPGDDGAMRVDLAAEEMQVVSEKLDSGPFAGMRVVMPKGFEDD